MTYEVSDRLKELSKQTVKGQQIVVEIPDLGLLLGVVPVERTMKIGDAGLKIGIGNLKIGGLITDPSQKDLIDKSASPTITQQILQDKGGSSSVTRMTFELVDKREELTKIFSPGQLVSEPLYKQSFVYFMLTGGSFPKDTIRLMTGLITDIEMMSGSIRIQITSSEEKKRRKAYTKLNTKLSNAIDENATTIPLEVTEGLFMSQDCLETYISIDKEIIKVGSISGLDLIDCVRGQKNTTAIAHDIGETVNSIYRFQGNAIDLSLKLLTSGSGVYASQAVTSFVSVKIINQYPNAIYFEGVDVKEKYGLVLGSLVSSSGALNGQNNFSERKITDIKTEAFGSYIIVDGSSLAFELDSNAVVTFKSQYDVLPQGCGFTPLELDIQEHIDSYDLLSASFFDYDFWEVDTMQVKSFIDEQVYYPSRLTSIPRKGKSSVKTLISPIAIKGTKILNETNIKDFSKLKIKRSINEFYYNEVTFKYGWEPLEKEFTKEYTTKSDQSFERISDIGSKTLTIECRGLNDSHLIQIAQTQKRYLKRYQFGAETISIDTLYGPTFDCEIGDSVIFGSTALQLSDSTTGDRKFKPRIMEIGNITNRPMKGKISMELIDTSSTLEGRFGVIGPSSYIKSGATSSAIPLKLSFTSKVREQDKWERYIGQIIRVHSPDFTYDHETTLIQFIKGKIDTIEVSPPLPSPPLEGYSITMPKYTGDSQHKALWKAIHCYFGAEIEIVNVISVSQVEVAGADIGKFFIGSILEIFAPDFSYYTGENIIKVTNITGNILTITPLPFLPVAGDKINLIGFSSDKGKPYRVL